MAFMENSKKSLLVLADYSACVRCKNLGEVGTHAPIEYCKKQNPDPYQLGEGEKLRIDSNTWLFGCSEFEWSGLPINEEAYQKIQSSSDYEKSKLLEIDPKFGLASKLTFHEITKGNYHGSYFNKEKFEKDNPLETRTK
jgi:hypothetical protein